MFGWCTTLGLPSISSEPDRERQPPSPPTPLNFPNYKPSFNKEEAAESDLKNIYLALATIRRPQDINAERFKPFNVDLESDVETSTIVRRPDVEWRPPRPWEHKCLDPASHSLEDGSPILMSNGNPFPSKEKFDILERELLLDNDDAFREVARLSPREGRERVRVTLARKFWMGLERMSQYWDSSLDNYYERPESPPRKPSDQNHTNSPATSEGTEKFPEFNMDMDGQQEAPKKKEHTKPPHAEEEMVRKYKGRRIGTGNEMPEDIREETIRALTEMAAWPFGCQVALPILPPRLSLKTLLFPIRQTFAAARSPKDRQLARSGVMEGPVFVAQCRPETTFRSTHDVLDAGAGEVCDLFREVGCMLLAAQERAREGMTEVKPGEGKWWTTQPRWGGAPNDSIGDNIQNNSDDEKPHSDPASLRRRSRSGHPFHLSRRPYTSRRLSNADKWKVVQPGPSLWDRRMRYIQIGKAKESPFDDIYMLSSINHHLAILHLRIHRRYLEIITNGDSDYPPESDNPDQPWYVLKVRRTKWHDLFDAQERLEVFRAIWSIFHHSLR